MYLLVVLGSEMQKRRKARQPSCRSLDVEGLPTQVGLKEKEYRGKDLLARAVNDPSGFYNVKKMLTEELYLIQIYLIQIYNKCPLGVHKNLPSWLSHKSNCRNVVTSPTHNIVGK